MQMNNQEILGSAQGNYWVTSHIAIGNGRKKGRHTQNKCFFSKINFFSLKEQLDEKRLEKKTLRYPDIWCSTNRIFLIFLFLP